MQLYIKNMVCSRCKMVVRNEIEKLHLHPVKVDLGEVEIQENLADDQKKKLNEVLLPLGFELINDKKSRLIEQIKNIIVEAVHYSKEHPETNYSEFISKKLHHDYTYLSNLFSSVEGTTIEKYIILQRIERVKELLVYDELSLSEIAYQQGYSSVAYLSNQFKKITGLTPSHFKKLRNKNRRQLEDL